MAFSITEKMTKQLEKNTAKLKELGYGPDGKLLPEPVKPAEEHPTDVEKLPFTKKPIMAQYKAMKKDHPDAILLFRVGDFYEALSDDAEVVAEVLKLPLSGRKAGQEAVQLAGFPHHALDTYLPRLIRAGKRVAICEELEDPKKSAKLKK